MDRKIEKMMLNAQKTEITEHHVYMRLAARCRDKHNAEVLRKIGESEKIHAAFWQSKTGVEVKPDAWKVFKTVFLARLLGLTFILKQMEKNEGSGSRRYSAAARYVPEAADLAHEESVHEKEILSMLDEEHLKYVGSVVLGLNDALVELTGSLAGFTLALGDTKVISLAGLVTGISAALSMAASDYLSSKAEGDETAKKSAVYTGVAYLVTVALLILPYLLLQEKFLALGICLFVAVVIIFLFNYYISIAQDLNFRQRFLEMTIISLSVAAFSFIIGYALKAVLGVDLG